MAAFKGSSPSFPPISLTANANLNFKLTLNQLAELVPACATRENARAQPDGFTGEPRRAGLARVPVHGQRLLGGRRGTRGAEECGRLLAICRRFGLVRREPFRRAVHAVQNTSSSASVRHGRRGWGGDELSARATSGGGFGPRGRDSRRRGRGPRPLARSGRGAPSPGSRDRSGASPGLRRRRLPGGAPREGDQLRPELPRARSGGVQGPARRGADRGTTGGRNGARSRAAAARPADARSAAPAKDGAIDPALPGRARGARRHACVRRARAQRATTPPY